MGKTAIPAQANINLNDYPHVVPQSPNNETWAACEGLRPETFHLQVFDLQHVAGLIFVKLYPAESGLRKTL